MSLCCSPWSLPQVGEEQDTWMPFFVYSPTLPTKWGLLHRALCSPPPLPVCMQVTESIPTAMTRFPSALPSPLLGFSLSFIAFRRLVYMLKVKEGGTGHWAPGYDARMQTGQLTFSHSRYIDYTCHTRSSSTHLQIWGWGGKMSKEKNEGDVHGLLQLLMPPHQSPILLPPSAESEVAGLEVGHLCLHFPYCGCHEPFIYT